MLNNIYRCVVEDNKDPKFLGRVRIRVVGVHDKRADLVPTDCLPWSETLNPIDGGGGGGVGSSTNIIQGVWGYCVPMNEALTEFLFIGTMNGKMNEMPKETDDDGNPMGFRDPDGNFPPKAGESTNKLARGEAKEGVTQDRIEVEVNKTKFKEPDDTAQNAKYPNNKVYEDLAGNIFEIDGTKGNERFRLQHSSGARIEINKDGIITISSKSDMFIKGSLIVDGTININGNITTNSDILAVGNVTSKSNIYSEGDVFGDSKGTNISLVNHKHTGNDGAPTSPPLP